jgi:hypothetical protein
MKTFLTLIASSLMTASLQAQTSNNQEQNGVLREVISIGTGIGFDYCGYGIGINVFPQKNIGVFANGGVFLAGPSYVVGLKGRYITKSKVDPYLSVGYGYSGCVAVADEGGHTDQNRSKIYRGLNIGTGIDVHFTNSFSLTAGLTTNRAYSDIEDYKDELEHKGYDFGDSFILPVGLSVGIKLKRQ